MSGLPSRYAKCKKCMKGSYPTTFLDLWNFLLCVLNLLPTEGGGSGLVDCDSLTATMEDSSCIGVTSLENSSEVYIKDSNGKVKTISVCDLLVMPTLGQFNTTTEGLNKLTMPFTYKASDRLVISRNGLSYNVNEPDSEGNILFTATDGSNQLGLYQATNSSVNGGLGETFHYILFVNKCPTI